MIFLQTLNFFKANPNKQFYLIKITDNQKFGEENGCQVQHVRWWHFPKKSKIDLMNCCKHDGNFKFEAILIKMFIS